ncbi:hypothetical protein KTN05_04555 [Paracoccus sp. Z118]|uniref:hypothetical protein n=1 Tax=Paracoccus sp. Z118 TaxID=2851017 RepID=UPI001C2BFD6E|nr:hypothetical protein [Paracoccus sp. Z118]MBV0891120.1 hypothetical protein [Paracoccus sp. Z118]
MPKILPHILAGFVLLASPAFAQTATAPVQIPTANDPAPPPADPVTGIVPPQTPPGPVTVTEQGVSSTAGDTGTPAPAQPDPALMEPAQTTTPATTQEALATPTETDPEAAAADVGPQEGAAQTASPAETAPEGEAQAATEPTQGTEAQPGTAPAAGTAAPTTAPAAAATADAPATEPAQPDPAALAAAQQEAARAFAQTLQAKSQAGVPLAPEEVTAIAEQPAITPVYAARVPEGDPASAQSLEPPAGQVEVVEPGDSDSVATPATAPKPPVPDGTAPGNEGSSGWSGGLGGSFIGTNPAGALPASKTWQPPTARGLDLLG